MYGYKHAERDDGSRLPDYIDHQLAAQSLLTIKIPRYNLELTGGAEFMAFRLPSEEYTSYDRREVYRTDIIGSARISGVTFYWLAQNAFHYGYRQGPQFNHLGQTVMWGLHVSFWN